MKFELILIFPKISQTAQDYFLKMHMDYTTRLDILVGFRNEFGFNENENNEDLEEANNIESDDEDKLVDLMIRAVTLDESSKTRS